jgi:RNA polymerase sigma-32 factor
MVNGELTDSAITKMCEELNVTPQQISEYQTRVLAFGKTTHESHDGDYIDIYETITDMTYEPSEVLSRIQREVAFETAMNGLSDRESKIIQERYMFDEEKASLMSLSSELGISQQRVSQIEQAAIKKLKKQLVNH